MSAKQKQIGFVQFISRSFGRKTAVECERECPNVIEFDLSWWIIIQGSEFELPG